MCRCEQSVSTTRNGRTGRWLPGSDARAITINVTVITINVESQLTLYTTFTRNEMASMHGTMVQVVETEIYDGQGGHFQMIAAFWNDLKNSL